MVALIAALCMAGCSANPVYWLWHDGRLRTYSLHVPPGHGDGALLPAVIMLHGGGGTGDRMARFTGFDALADQEGFLVVYPNAVRRHWNDGRGGNFYSHRTGVDDTGFLDALIERLIEQHRADPAAIFMTGASNGGMMTYRFACERPERLAAMAPVIAGVPEPLAEGCTSETSLPALIINGTEDPLVPFEGGPVTVRNRESGRVLGAFESAALLAQRNGCPALPNEEALPEIDPDDGTHVIRYTYSACRGGAEVVLYVIEGGGHTWPGGMQYLPVSAIGRTSHELDGTETIWDFFKRYLD